MSRAAITAFVAALFITACSGGGDAGPAAPTAASESLAVSMITGDLATTLGLGPLLPACDDPGVYSAETVFACTASTQTGQVINVHASVNADGRLSLATTNVISAPALPSFEREVASILNNNVGSNFTAEAIDCGPSAVVLPPDLSMTCALVMPSSGEIFDVTLMITDLEGRAFALQVADVPRSAQAEAPVDGAEQQNP
ncbi:MAG: hypothetical protein AAGD35_22840 [Actinomycetota bacterium]